MDDALCIFPNFFTTGATAAGRKSIPPGTAVTLPIRFAIGLPFTFGTRDLNIFHKINLIKNIVAVSDNNFGLVEKWPVFKIHSY
jgi:hypothetical protein